MTMRLRRSPLGFGLALAVALFGAALVPAGATAKPLVEMHASFIPYRLGEGTTVRFGFEVTARDGEIPSPLSTVILHLPKGLNQNASELGLDICRPAILARRGPRGCPVNSKVGFGTTEVEATFGGDRIRQKAQVSTFVGPPESAAELLFYSESRSPIASRVIYKGKGQESSEGPFGGALETTIPLIPTVPAGNFLATTSFESTLGPLGLTYRRRIGHRLESFQPEGILLPRRCPRGGFRFRVDLRFSDGVEAADRSTLPCPRRGSAHRRQETGT